MHQALQDRQSLSSMPYTDEPAPNGILRYTHFKSVLYNLKLQLSYRADYLSAVKLINEHLCHALIHKLIYTFVELLALHRVVILYILEHFRRERRQSSEMQYLSVCQRITYLEDAIVGQSYDIAWIRLIDSTLALRHKLRRRRKAESLSLTYMQIRMIALKLTAADLTESDARTMVGVDVCCNLKDKACKLRLIRRNHTFLSLDRLRTRSYLNETIQQFLHTKVVQSTTENTGATSALR